MSKKQKLALENAMVKLDDDESKPAPKIMVFLIPSSTGVSAPEKKGKRLTRKIRRGRNI